MKILGWAATAVVGLVAVLAGLMLAKDGLTLLSLGGSWYYLLAGVGLVTAGLLLAARRPAGGILYGLILLATLAWAVWEAGFSFWALTPRVVAPVLLGLLFLAAAMSLPRRRRGGAVQLLGAGSILGLALMCGALVLQYAAPRAAAQTAEIASVTEDATPDGEWRTWSHDAAGTRFSPLRQVNADNVKTLKPAWVARTGHQAREGGEDENTPLQIGDALYVCTPANVVIALDAETGAERWRHDPGVNVTTPRKCRGLGYFEVPAQTLTVQTPCAKRIILATLDGRLIALDAVGGGLCAGFGEDGVVYAGRALAPNDADAFGFTSAPTIAGGLVVVGGRVMDNLAVDEPSGVIRAFSAVTGEPVWAWNAGEVSDGRGPFTRGTPNMWSNPAYDEALGLLFIPTGNATPDYWASHRSPASERYGSSVVALRVADGHEVWRFQTVHHDLWDWDVAPQPMLVDMPVNGVDVPALVQPTKSGQVFVLDRRTGVPLVETQERAVPQDAAPGEWTSPTQPFSTGMPSVGFDRLKERNMWGVSPLDHLHCRIWFRRLRYEGPFTPPGLEETLQYPGDFGGMNWGGAAYDAIRGRLIVNVIHMPQTVRLERTAKAQFGLARASLAPRAGAVSYEAIPRPFLSNFRLPVLDKRPFGISCIAPPFGEMAAIDLRTRTIAWQVPTGSARNSGLGKLRLGVNIPVGEPSAAGSVVTAGGLVFHAATTDRYLRAYEAATGRELWRGELPMASNANPMTYVSPGSGRQFIVVTAGGAPRRGGVGDYVVAFALPD